MSNDRKAAFVRALAVLLVGDQAMQSMKLEMGDVGAQKWAALRGTTPLMGYPTVEEAEKQLAEWLGITPLPPAPKPKAKAKKSTSARSRA